MQKAPVLKGSGLQPLKETTEEVHVFGRNLEDRVITNEDEEEQQQPQSSDLNAQQTEGDVDIRKRKFEAITGEEEEETIFQGDFKLYVWDLASSNWIEKGRGQLKLNDSLASNDGPESRLIMRISGTLRILLNVAIRKSFRIISSSKTNLRFTDGQTMWAVSGGTADKLAEFIEPRVEKVKEVSKDDGEDDGKGVKKTKKEGEQDDDKDQDKKSETEKDVDKPVAEVEETPNTDKPHSEDHIEKPIDEPKKSQSSPVHHSQSKISNEKSNEEESSAEEGETEPTSSEDNTQVENKEGPKENDSDK